MKSDCERYVIIGDVHGCLAEMKELIRRCDYDWRRDRLVFLGDFMDRGLQPVETVREVMRLCLNHGAWSVIGNHDNKHVRWRKHYERCRLTGASNPVKLHPNDGPERAKRTSQNLELSLNEIEWFGNLPRWIRLPTEHPVIAVHAGLENGLKLEEQDIDAVIHIRKVNKDTGRRVSKKDASPGGTCHWSEVWNGPESVVYGHRIHGLDKPHVVHHAGASESYSCFGIDTGCYAGGHLTAMILDQNGVTYKFQQVKASGVWGKWFADDEEYAVDPNE